MIMKLLGTSRGTARHGAQGWVAPSSQKGDGKWWMGPATSLPETCCMTAAGKNESQVCLEGKRRLARTLRVKRQMGEDDRPPLLRQAPQGTPGLPPFPASTSPATLVHYTAARLPSLALETVALPPRGLLCPLPSVPWLATASCHVGPVSVTLISSEAFLTA